MDYRSSFSSALRFERTYNSHADLHPDSGDVGLGKWWRGTYLQHLLYSSGGGRKGVFAYRPNGSVILFHETPTGLVADGDVKERLEWVCDSLGTAVGWALITENDDREIYDLDGRLLSIVSRSGISVTAQYDAIGYLASITDQFGNALQFDWDSTIPKRISQVIRPDGEVIIFTYGANDNLTGVHYPDGTQRQYVYENLTSGKQNLLTGLFDEAGLRFTTWTYNNSNAPASSQHAGGVDSYSIAYSGMSRTITDPLGVARTYTVALVNGLLRYTAASSPCIGCGEYSSVTYDAAGNWTSRRDHRSVETRRVVDAARTLETSRTEAFGTPRARTIDTTWHPTYRLPTQIDETGRRTTYTHDANGNILTKTVLDTVTSESRTWTYTYNNFGQVLTADGPRTDVSDVTTYTYYNCTTGYECGQIETITDALGHVTTYNTYNAHGQPLTITDPNGVVTTLSYDLRQRLTSRTVGTELTSFEYWPTGLLKKATLPDGSYVSYTYDAAHRLTDISDALGNTIHYTLDAMGNRTNEQIYDPSSALTRTRTRVFNTLNQLWKEIGAAGGASVTTEYGYDNNGNQTSIAAPLGRTTSESYDELNRLTDITDPATGLTHYGYNALDQLISVTDPRSLTTSYGYNALGDLKTLTSPDTGTTTNTYDSGGNLQTSTDARGAIATYTYDALNRVQTVAFTKGSTTDTITYTYDQGSNGIGRLTGASDASHSMSWAYDALGRLTSRSQTIGSLTRSVSYGYTNGQLTSMTTPSGQTITYGHDAAGQVSSVSVNGTTLLSNILYDPFGPVRQWTWGNGTLAVRTYDEDGKLTQIDSAGLNTYGYDDAFRITSITDTADAANSWSYGYDSLDRLNSASKSGTSIGYSYDANGNRLSQTGTDPSTYTVSTTSNRLGSVTGAVTRSYGYDAAGNTTSDGTATITYNNRGRMKTHTKAGNTNTFTFNALGQMIRKAQSSGTSIFFYDEAGHFLGHYTSTGTLYTEIVWLGDTPVATLRPESGGGIDIFYIHTDHLNTPRRITRPSDNKLRWRWDPDPFGNGSADNNPENLGAFNTFLLRFPGQIAFGDLGLFYNYYRDYDPATGRYTTSDPIGLAGGINTYAYVGSYPIGLIDPFGLDAADVGTVIGCGIGGGIGSTIGGTGGAAGGLLCGPGAVACSPAGAAAGAAAGGVVGCAGGAVVGRSIGQVIDKLCSNDPDECAKIEAAIAALASELRSRYLMAQLDPNNLYDRARVRRISRRGGSYLGHRQQFLEKQATLRELIAAADANGCKVAPEDRLLSSVPYPDMPVGR